MNRDPMNFFQHLRSNYGQDVVKQVRKGEDLERRLARHRNHRVFTLRCKHENITPPSLRIKCPINTKRAHDIINKARKDLVSERIRVTTHKIYQIQAERDWNTQVIGAKLASNDLLTVQVHFRNSHKGEFNRTKWRDVNKLQCLIDRDKSRSTSAEDVDLSGTQLKRWVVNLSNKTLNKN